MIRICYLSYAYADVSAMFGTVDNPQINGVAYEVHKPYIEANAGFSRQAQIESLAIVEKEVTPLQASTSKVDDSTLDNSAVTNFKSDSWATNVKVEKALRQAASGGKLNYVLEEAKKASAPAAVAIVPMVESNYNKNAISPKGAGGAWQLMPGTANDYGISSKDRFDFNSSTKVAIQILNDLHSEFGNWVLAFAAYNCGEQCVRNALKRNPGATTIDELSLPRETKDYVHKIISLNQVIAGLKE
ncbi:MAG: rane-bound lytic murein transglycosylase [Pseudomonadota bacterium]|nr:rane-bound lytic murein transglycosylase [Pseudomonadota bacterium]